MCEAEETEKEIEARSNEYRPVAKRASLLYFCLADLAVVSETSTQSLLVLHIDSVFLLLFSMPANTPGRYARSPYCDCHLP